MRTIKESLDEIDRQRRETIEGIKLMDDDTLKNYLRVVESVYCEYLEKIMSKYNIDDEAEKELILFHHDRNLFDGILLHTLIEARQR